MRVAIVGAGLSGLAAGRALHDDGHTVVLIDKGRGPGGRLATRRIGAARFDHGAQFFTVRSDRFAADVDRWHGAGLVKVWCHGFAEEDGYPRFVVEGGVNALAKRLAAGLDLRAPAMAFAIRPGDDGSGWAVGLDDGTAIETDVVIVTTPLPQAYALLITSGVELPDALNNVEYDRTIALLAVLDGTPAVPTPGGLQGAGIFSFIGDNQAKGISPVPAVTFHAGPGWSEEHWGDTHETLDDALRTAAAPWLGDARIVDSQVKKWRFATPRTIWPEPCWSAPPPAAPLVVAGDAFAGPRVEGAYLSGLAAADVIIDRRGDSARRAIA